jgi:PAS domain-containing protein
MSASASSRPRRRRQASQVRRTPAQLREERRPRRVGLREMLAAGAVVIICVALISLIWITAERSVREQTDDTLGRVEAAITAQAATLAVQARHELQMIDQSLNVLETAWNDNPDTFDLAKWQKTMPALTEIADDLFIANDKRVIVQDINPAAVGQGIGSAYATFGNGSLEPIQTSGPGGRDNAMVVGELGSGGVTRQYMMYLVRPLARPPGWIIGASYRSKALTTVFALAGLGQGGLAAMVDTHRGGVQALAGTAALRPKLAIGDTPMFAAMQERPDGGVWIGPTAIDGVQRILAFRRIPGRDLLVVVGVPSDLVMAPAENWAAGVRSLAAMASLLVLAIGGAVLWELWHWRSIRRRRRALTQAEALLTAVQGDLAATRVRAAAGAAQVRAMLGGVSAGVAVIDGEQHLAAWNTRFVALSGLAGDPPSEGMPLEELLRRQALAGWFGAPEDIEAEVARLVPLLRPASGVGEIAGTAPDGTSLVLRSQATPDGGTVLILQAADTATAAVAAA